MARPTIYHNWGEYANHYTIDAIYVIDQPMLSICDINKMFGGEGKQNPRDSKLTAMLIIYLISMDRS